jgi:hypothetical protein
MALITSNKSVEKAQFSLFSDWQLFDFIDSDFMKNNFFYTLNVSAQAVAVSHPLN